MASEDKMVEVVLKYNMQGEEVDAYRLARFYVYLSIKFFPSYSHSTLPKTGDPRKCLLFRYCYKLIKDTADLTPEDRKLYLFSQFAMLKKITFSDGSHPLVSPAMLVSKKAWGRWLIWKKTYDRIVKKKENNFHPSIDKIKKQLIATSDFLKDADCEQIVKWVTLGKISPYYLVLSPLVKKWMAESQINLVDYGIDLSLYENSPELQSVFFDIFPEQKI